MSYATLTDLTNRFGADEIVGLADRDGDDQPDTDLIASVSADVDAEIDTHLAGRYPLPLSPVPRVLVNLACVMIRERLYLAQGGRLDDTDPVRREAEAARKLLREIGAGKAHLPLPTRKPGGGDVHIESAELRWNRRNGNDYV